MANNDTPMDAATLEALKGSIAKWEGIVAGTVKDEGPDNCPLCMKFYEFGSSSNCIGCPVMASTGLKYCAETPYTEFTDLDDGFNEGSSDGRAADRKAAAQAELDFLRSLLPAEESAVAEGAGT